MRRTGALLFALALPGCTGGQEPPPAPGPPRSPQEAVEAVWATAALGDPAPETLRAVFVEAPLATQTPRLLDLLDTLRGLTPTVVRVEPLPGLGRTALDLRADLPAGGMAALSIQVEECPDGTWRVAWLAAPGGSWPVPEKPAL